MPVPTPPGSRPRLTRRAALAVLGSLAATSACTNGRPTGADPTAGPTTAPVTQPARDPDVVVATDALAAQRAMLALLAAVSARHGRLGGRLVPVTAAHEAHVDLLDGAVPTQAPSPAPTASPARTNGPATEEGPEPAPRVHNAPERALRQVIAAERELATTTKRLAFVAQSGAFARLLGSIAASAAQQAQVLQQGDES